MRRAILSVVPFALFLAVACDDGGGTPMPDAAGGADADPGAIDGGGCGGAFAPATLNGTSMTFIENGGALVNTWTFGAGTATLAGAGDFGFTYSRSGDCSSTVTFDVGGMDVYQLTWSSAAGGTCTEQFAGGAVNPCTFSVP